MSKKNDKVEEIEEVDETKEVEQVEEVSEAKKKPKAPKAKKEAEEKENKAEEVESLSRELKETKQRLADLQAQAEAVELENFAMSKISEAGVEIPARLLPFVIRGTREEIEEAIEAFAEYEKARGGGEKLTGRLKIIDEGLQQKEGETLSTYAERIRRI